MSKHDTETYVAVPVDDLPSKIAALDEYLRDSIEDRKRHKNYDAQLALQTVRRKMAKLGLIEGY